MAGFYPVPATRTTGLLGQTRLLQQMFADQIALQRLQNQISTGRRIAAPSEDAPAAQRGQTLQRLLELKAQAAQNLKTGQSYLDASDAALGNVTKLISDIKAVALEAASDTSTDATRAVAAEEVRRAIDQLLTTGNHNFRGRYLFAGSRSGEVPFRYDGTRIVYVGNEGALDSFVDLDLPYATNASGADVFGTFSSQVAGAVDLNPALLASTPLADLHGGRGVMLGSIAISDGASTQIVDLSSAATIGDVAELLEANPPAGRTITATVTATGLSIDIDDAGGGNLTIREVAGGNTAQQLRILNTTGTGVAPIAGGDLNPRLRLTTELADLQTSLPLDLTSGVQIQSNGQTYIVDTSAAVTVEDLLNAFRRATGDVVAEIDLSGTRLVVRSRLSGADFAIGENGGTTAAQLGLRSLTLDTPLAELNHGRGVATKTGVDFTIRRKDGVLLPIDVSSAYTLGDVIDLINNDAANLNPATRALARLSASGNGIELFDGNVAGTDTLAVLREFGSDAAWDLGLVPRDAPSATATTSGSGDVLTGVDPNPQEVGGVFNALLRLHDALTDFDRGELERAVNLLDDGFERANFARGEIGARGRTLEHVQTQLEDEEVLLSANLADEIEVDLAEAISSLAARQASYEASLRLAAQLFQTSLLNFL